MVDLSQLLELGEIGGDPHLLTCLLIQFPEEGIRIGTIRRNTCTLQEDDVVHLSPSIPYLPVLFLLFYSIYIINLI